MKKLLFMLLAFLPLSIWADPVKIGDLYYELDEASCTATVTSHPNEGGYSGDIVIPSTVEYGGITYNVTQIGYYAFSHCSGLLSVTIPNSVTCIEMEAFLGCSNLTTIEIPASVTSIGENAFAGCSSLISMSVNSGNIIYDSRDNCNAIIETESNTLISGCQNTIIPTSVTSIGKGAFRGISSLTSIVIPTSVTTIGDEAFTECTGLTSINIPNSVTSIGGEVFNGCSNLSSVNIPNSVTNIGSGAFRYCANLTTIDIPNSVTNLEEYLFDGCSSLTSFIIPSSVATIGGGVFWNCNGLTSIYIPSNVISIGEGFYGDYSLTFIIVDDNNQYYDSRDNCNAIIEKTSNTLIVGCKNTVIPNSVTKIGNGAFHGNTQLTSIDIPNSIEEIGPYAFSGTNLSFIEIPDNVNNIGTLAFEGCSNLTTFVCKSDTPPSCDDNIFEGTDISQATLYVPATSIETYRATYPWSGFGKIRPINIDVTIGSTGYATYCSEYDLDFNTITDFKAYIVVGYNKKSGNVTVVSVKDAPAGTGLLLKGTSGTYQVPCGESGSIYSNMLVGVTEETIINTTDGVNTNFTLQNGSKGVGFYAVKDNHTMAAHRAYLQIPNSMLSSSANQVGLEFEEGVTSINETNMVEEGDAIWFSLDGRQLNSKPTKKGVYVTNGRKVVIK